MLEVASITEASIPFVPRGTPGLLTEQERAVVRFAVEMLPDPDRKIILHRYWDGWTLRRTGAAIGLSGERVRQIQKRAHREVRWWLEFQFGFQPAFRSVEKC